VRQRVILAVAVVLGVLALAVAVDLVTASPRVCASCHEMAPRTQAWEKSAHAQTSCVKCHQPPTEWYQLPQRLVGRAKLLGHDVKTHVKGDYTDPVDARVPGTAPVQDEVCLQCHDVNRKATSGFRILIDHAAHAKRNGSCVSCHVRTAHPVETRGNAMSLMSQCFTCHGTAEQPKASADCRVCHPADYELLPKSHDTPTWKKREHGVVAKADPKQCEMCHNKAFCYNCHGLQMPHPAGWAKGSAGHAATAQLNRAVCTQCHGSRPDMCTMCHHDSYDPTQGTWVKQHFTVVRSRGVTKCLECHSAVFCTLCHVQDAIQNRP
jgi:hypothetical protein